MKKGYIQNRNSFLVRGIEGFVKGVYTSADKIYILIQLVNRSSITYDIESASFITSPAGDSGRELATEEKVFMPIHSIQPEKLPKKSKTSLVYVFDKFTLSDDKNLSFVMNEVNGERTVILNIQPKYISRAELIH